MTSTYLPRRSFVIDDINLQREFRLATSMLWQFLME